MRKIGDLRYEDCGIVIVFLPAPTSLAKEMRYTFFVENDERLTEILKQSVKTIEVVERYISTRARTLFETISNGILVPMASEEELNLLLETFFKKFGKMPVFKMKETSPNGIPTFCSSILNTNIVSKDGIGRTKLESRVNSLKNLFSLFY